MKEMVTTVGNAYDELSSNLYEAVCISHDLNTF